MKNFYILLAGCAVMAMGCSSTSGSRSDYFGYRNTVRHSIPQSEQQQADADAPQETADAQQNTVPPAPAIAPTTQQDNPFALTNTGDVYIDNYYAGESDVEYVPVIVPWWERYYDPYYYHCRTYRPVVVVRYGYYDTWCYNTSWYTPWYHYHPCYGWSYHPHVVYPPVVHYPRSYNRVSDGRTVKRRTFGSYTNYEDDGATATTRGTRSGTTQQVVTPDDNTIARRAQRTGTSSVDVVDTPNPSTTQPATATPRTPRSRADVVDAPNPSTTQPTTATPGTPRSRADVVDAPNPSNNQPTTATPGTRTEESTTVQRRPSRSAETTTRDNSNTTVQRRPSRSAETTTRDNSATTVQRRPSRSAETTTRDNSNTTQQRPARQQPSSATPAPARQPAPAAEPAQTTTRRGGRNR